MSSKQDWRFHQDPWHPADYDDQVLYAVRAFKDGNANDGQQKLVWDWLMYVSCQEDWAFRPGAGSDAMRSTDIVLGRQFVGRQFTKMLDWRLNPKSKGALSTETKPIKAPRKKRVKNAA